MPNPSIIDPAAIENLRALTPGDNGEFLREIVGIFVTDMPERLRELDESLRSADTQRFMRAAHSIKGSASNLGAVAVGKVAERLETLSHGGQLEPLAPMIAELRDAFGQAQRELERIAK